MNVLSKKFGASGSIDINITAAGIEVKVTDDEKLSTNQVDEVIKYAPVVEGIEKLLGGGSLVTSGGNMLIDELNSLAAKP